MVSDLIKQGKWDSDLVEDSFNERDPACILSIPLSNYTEDSFFWLFEKRRVYSVKYAYCMLSTSLPSISVDPVG